MKQLEKTQLETKGTGVCRLWDSRGDEKTGAWGNGQLLPLREVLRTQISSGSLGLAGLHRALGLSGIAPSNTNTLKGHGGNFGSPDILQAKSKQELV